MEEWEQTTRSTILKTGVAKITTVNKMPWIMSFFMIHSISLRNIKQ